MSATPIFFEDEINTLLTEAFALRINNLPKSINITQKALEKCITANAKSLMAKCYSKLAFYHMILGQHNVAVEHANKANEIFEFLHDEVGSADVKYTIASIYYKTNKLQLGLKHLLECLDVFIKYNDYASQAKTYKSVGTIYEYFGDIDSAFEAYHSAVETSKKVGDINLMTNVYNPLSGLYLNMDDIEKAMELIERTIELKTQTSDIRGIAFAYYGRGKIFAKTNQFELAEADYLKSIDIHIEMGEKLGLAMSYLKIAILYFDDGMLSNSKSYAEKALELSVIYKMDIIKSKASFLMYEIFKKEGDLKQALYFLEVHQRHVQENVHSQTFQIVDSYKMIHQLASKNFEDRILLEKATLQQEKDKVEYVANLKQDFLSNMSHEIRTPLNAIITIPNLLKDRADAEDRQLLESLKFASNNLLLLINDILDFTKLETDKIQLDYKPTHLKTLLQNITNTYESLAKEKGLLLDLKIDDSISAVFSLDEIKLAQILGNLISNAIKFTDEGSVQLLVTKLEEKENSSQLLFEVIDTGIGIPKSFLGEIFESFTQPKSVTTKKQAGSGLGLAIVKKLAALFNTEVKIKTKEGVGSTFYFELLLQKDVLNIVSKKSTNSQLHNLKVLIAEDNKINMLVATKLLSKWGVHADCAIDGREALEKAKQNKYDVILMDIHMPELNGYDASIKIREKNNLNTDTPIFAFTADIIANTKENYAKHFSGFLRKPIEIDELYNALNSIKN